ncbi:hypothetical protein ASPZODRAFT_148118 [Penicilliopsis zonata CBS 506.65]|uniref:nitric oxide dioxygenase n=1 Tax=Penicilliopsis zonata CBS 506.65 TaxID=1073090 RepID=A0A1L9STW7_9EURO|nr:hypothetical protein ASPZODRAFT_148118 [Penicilliopsis zonata CBS 506.65]OJJ50650.1 hypothetical protein ASPZODRAFT_148118 [Penicilliopsis zonata CBS 506.65]
MPLTPEQVTVIKATVPVLQEYGNAITTAFYRNMLNAHPELRTVFNMVNQTNGHQQRALAGAVFAYASHIDDLGALGPAVELICHKHASLYIQPEQYQIVGKFLLEAMAEVLGDALTPAIHDAWAAAYWQLADIMIGREKQLYDEADGWTDWRQFKVARKTPESAEITSFYLEPVDGKPLPAFQPGQYISVRVPVPELGYVQPRQYSLSDRPDPSYYRISVKKEAGLASGDKAHPGYVSNVLHGNVNEGDLVDVSHPYGDFFLSSSEAATPVVLLSAGVGLTPLTSMLNTITAQGAPHPERKIHFIHGAHTTGARAFSRHILGLNKQFPNLNATFFVSAPAADDRQGVDYHHVGRINLQKLDLAGDLYLDNPETEYYVCGPTAFMTDMKTSLSAQGVADARIKMELFGTGGI